METTRLTGSVLFSNVITAKKFKSGAGFVEDPTGDYQLTITVDKNDKDYLKFQEDVKKKIAEAKSTSQYKRLISDGVSVKFSFKCMPNSNKDGEVLNDNKMAITMKRKASKVIGNTIKKVEIDAFNKFNEKISLDHELGMGTKVQVAIAIGESYFADKQTWYIPFRLLAIMVKEEAVTSYGFDVDEPSIPEGELFEGATPFEGETPPPYEPSEVPF